MSHTPLIVALDFSSPSKALELAETLDPSKCRLKVGYELFLAGGHALIEKLTILGYEIFLDLKFHDIPNTVAAACRVAATMNIWMLNVHASGGKSMLEAAREAIDKTHGKKPLLIAVTVLTSMNNADLRNIGITSPASQQVARLATLAHECRLDGVVCSGQETSIIKQTINTSEFKIVTPGIRLSSHNHDDQQRIMTPELALKDGADYLVIGRPITKSEDPPKVLDQIVESINRFSY